MKTATDVPKVENAVLLGVEKPLPFDANQENTGDGGGIENEAMKKSEIPPKSDPIHDLLSIAGLPPEVRKRAEQVEAFLQGMQNFGKKLVKGKATLDDWIPLVESAPREFLEVVAAKKPECLELYSREKLAFFKRLQALQKPTTPEESQLAAIFRLLEKHLKIDVFDFFARITAQINIEWHLKTGMPLLKSSLEKHDQNFFAELRLAGTQNKPSAVLLERQRIAAREGDDSFPRRLKRSLKKEPDMRCEKLIEDLQLSSLHKCLLTHWSKLLPNCQPSIGLCDFKYSAIQQFCQFRHDPKGSCPDQFDEDKVRDAVRRLGLIRRKPFSVTGFGRNAKTNQLFVVINDQNVGLTKG